MYWIHRSPENDASEIGEDIPSGVGDLMKMRLHRRNETRKVRGVRKRKVGEVASVGG